MKLEFDNILDFYELSELVVAGRKVLGVRSPASALSAPKKTSITEEEFQALRVGLGYAACPTADATTSIAADYGVPTNAAGGTSEALCVDEGCPQSSIAHVCVNGRPAAEAGLPGKDAEGAPYNADWHSDPAKVTAKGVWRARRGRDEPAYKDWLRALVVEAAEATFGTVEAEPVATETHALPQDDPSAEEPDAATNEANGLQAELDHAALIEASQEAAKDAPDGTIDLLNAGKEFIKEYGTVKFEALKAAVSPLEDGKGKPIPSLTPGERRLLRACMDNYALYL